MEWERMPSHYLAHGLRKLKPQVQNPEDNKLRSLRLDLDCSANEAAEFSEKQATGFVIRHTRVLVELLISTWNGTLFVYTRKYISTGLFLSAPRISIKKRICVILLLFRCRRKSHHIRVRLLYNNFHGRRAVGSHIIPKSQDFLPQTTF